jgi:radical SAM protein with 4Fe4S-binding SPASM domain
MNDLDIGIIERLLVETRPVKSDVYLWGGEPLVYSEWNALVELLAADTRVTVLCTNGVGLEGRAGSLARIGPGLTCLVCVDGLREDNDSIRGGNTFRHATSGISRLLEMKKSGTFAGEVSVSAVLSARLIPRLVEFVEYFDAVGVNTLYLVFPWYIPRDMASRMDEYFASSFDWLSMPGDGASLAGRPSWHSYQFHLPPGNVPELAAKMAEIEARRWRIRVRFRPDVSPDEVAGFAAGSDRPAEGRKRCLSVATRLSVLPDGRVTTCKLFPEFVIGDLKVSPLADLWHGEQARRARAVLSRGLTPVCSKCVQLYLHGE